MASDKPPSIDRPRSTRTGAALALIAVRLVVVGAILFLAAGDWRWPASWMFLGLFGSCSAVMTAWLARHDPALLQSRLSFPVRRDQRPWDRVFMAALIVAATGWAVTMALDARRFGWSHSPLWTQAVGGALIVSSMIVVCRSFRVNSFAAPQVRVQSDRGQQVVGDGPYSVVRHPMYAAAIPFLLGVPLLLGSWFGLLAVPLFVVSLAGRAVGEERMLRRALTGYDDYARRVRFRLVPGLW